jgi:hypothetical protein
LAPTPFSRSHPHWLLESDPRTTIRTTSRQGNAIFAASALQAGCDTLWSEDMRDGVVLDGRLRIVKSVLRGGLSMESST